MTTYNPIIGLEVHIELATNSKMFCGCPADHFGKEPNTHTCPVCLGLPGALPVANKKAVEWTILLGLALECEINQNSKFDRKNYFYPDLAKGYQISQYDQPLAHDGELNIKYKSGEEIIDKKIRIRRVHIEEDTGKLQHTTVDGKKVSLVDFNRCGVPLVEVVTEPDFRSLEEVDVYLKKLQQIVRYLGISSADMEKGSMRLEPSISITANIKDITDKNLPNYRVELKNINSFRFAKKALEYEIKRQSETLEKGETPTQQTRGWDDVKNVTVPQREKEEAHDYRYFPEPDIPPMHFEDSNINDIKSQLPELPDVKYSRFIEEYKLTDYDASQLVEDKAVADYYEEAIKVSKSLKMGAEVTEKIIANWIINKKVNCSVTVPGELIKLITQTSSTTVINDSDLEQIVDKVLNNNPGPVSDYKKGKVAVIGLFIGQVLKEGNFDKNKIIEILNKKLTIV